MAKLKVIQYRCFKYTAWPYDVYRMHKINEHGAALWWLMATLKKSHYRFNYDRNSFKWYPNSATFIGYHFKYETDCLAFTLKFGPGVTL